MKNIKRYIISFFILTILSFPAFYANAATIGFSPSKESFKVGDTINVKVYVATGSQSINAISANIKFPSDILSLSSVSKTGSIINLWAQDPSFSNKDGTASFEGVILNGYTGSSGNAVTLIFKAKSNGVADLSFTMASVLANDGNGTEVLSGKSKSILTISKIEPIAAKIKVEVPSVVKKENTLVKAPVKDTTIAISEIKNDTGEYSPNKFLVISPQIVADKSYSIQIDSIAPIIWTDDGSHIYQAPELSNGIHTIKIMAVDVNSDTLSGFLNFSTTVLKVPTITYYPRELYTDQFMVLKGTADPLVDVELNITNITTGGVNIDHVTTNSDGKFTYVPDYKIISGLYSIIARANTLSGIHSKYMDPIQVLNKEHELNFFISKFNNYAILLVPTIALIILLILVILSAYYKIKKFRIVLNKKIQEAESLVSRSFDILDEDAGEEIAIFRKIRTGKMLDKDEQVFLDKFKKDIKEAEKIIQKELKKIEK